jgi:uncharacterized protein (TIRG00374 family)
LRSHIKTILLFTIVAVLLWWFARNLDWALVVTDLRAADWRLILAAVCLVYVTYLVRALRWRTFLRPFADVNLGDIFAATTVGFSALFLIGRAAEIVRPAFLSLREPRVRPAASFMTIAVERICDMAMIAVMFAAALLFVQPAGDDTGARFALMRRAGLLMLVSAIVGIFCLILLRRFAPLVVTWIETRTENRAGIIRRGSRLLTSLLRGLADALGVFTDIRALLATAGWTSLLWSIITIIHLLVLTAFGLRLGVASTIFVMGCSLVGSLVPTPGGAAGTYHAATAGGLALLGAPEERAVASAFVLHLVVWSPALLFGIYYFLRSGVNFGRLREVAAESSAAPAQHSLSTSPTRNPQPTQTSSTTAHVVGEASV